jgi:hypothetical protein
MDYIHLLSTLRTVPPRTRSSFYFFTLFFFVAIPFHFLGLSLAFITIGGVGFYHGANAGSDHLGAEDALG